MPDRHGQQLGRAAAPGGRLRARVRARAGLRATASTRSTSPAARPRCSLQDRAAARLPGRGWSRATCSAASRPGLAYAAQRRAHGVSVEGSKLRAACAAPACSGLHHQVVPVGTHGGPTSNSPAGAGGPLAGRAEDPGRQLPPAVTCASARPSSNSSTSSARRRRPTGCTAAPCRSRPAARPRRLGVAHVAPRCLRAPSMLRSSLKIAPGSPAGRAGCPAASAARSPPAAASTLG
jgi:hypothetical protein